VRLSNEFQKNNISLENQIRRPYGPEKLPSMIVYCVHLYVSESEALWETIR
jgi:hypothetical protein